MKPFTFYFLLFTFLNVSSFAQQSKSLTNFINDDAVKNAAVSIYVANAANGEQLLATTPQITVTPASVLKLITTATALEKYGKDYRFSTLLWTSGKIENGVLSGNLVITGGGDPTLGSTNFNTDQPNFIAQWVHAIKKAGIDSIAGNLVIDPYLYSDQDVPQTWVWEDLGSYYGAAAQGISLYDNTFEIAFRTSDSAGILSEIKYIHPAIDGLKIDNQVLSSNENRDKAYILGSPYDSYRIIKGTLPKGKSTYTLESAIPDPARQLAFELQNSLRDSSIVISGEIKKEKVKPIEQLLPSDSILIRWESPVLSDIIEKLNHESVNLYAEQLCKHMGFTTFGEGSTQAGIKAILQFWKEKGINTKNLFIADGSGLSRYNAITAKTLVDVMVFMKQNAPDFDSYLNSVPLTGLQGTQKNYFHDSILKGKARAKTGSMTRVRSMAGYMTTQTGKEIAFAIMVNNFTCTGSEMAKKMEILTESFFLEY